jgi:hypothetical protein
MPESISSDTSHLAATDGRLITERVTAKVDSDELTVFLIGMRINRPWKIHRWLPVARAMGQMIQELYAHPELGFRHVERSWCSTGHHRRRSTPTPRDVTTRICRRGSALAGP